MRLLRDFPAAFANVLLLSVCMREFSMLIKKIPILILCSAIFGCASHIENNNDVQACHDTSEEYFCPLDTVCCQGQCVKLSEENCGTCGNVCHEFEACEKQASGQYQCVCAADHLPCSLSCCASGCVELSTNPANCGTCGTQCEQSQICTKGICQCSTPLSACGGECVDKKTNVKHCGECGNVCPDSTNTSLHLEYSICQDGYCNVKCVTGYSNDDVDLSNGCEKSLFECGNGIADEGEECDKNDLRGQTCNTKMGSGFAGMPTCKPDCTLDLSSCVSTGPYQSTCGNNVKEVWEVCDGTDLNNKTCETEVGKGSTGTLKCMENCDEFITDGCSPKEDSKCGNKMLDAGEECDSSKFQSNKTMCDEYDPKYTSNGSVSCNADCTVNFDNCQEKQTGGPGNSDGVTIKIKVDIQPSKKGDYSAEHIYETDSSGSHIIVKLHGNYTSDSLFYMKEDSFIEITGLNGLSEMKIHYKTKAENGFTVTAGSYKESFDLEKQDNFTYQEIKITTPGAQSVVIDSVKAKPLIIDEISWK